MDYGLFDIGKNSKIDALMYNQANSGMSFPRRRESTKPIVYMACWIPAFAGMTIQGLEKL